MRALAVVAREATDVDLELRWFTFFGKVTRDGQPVAAELYGTVSDATTGRYDAVLARNPRTNPNSITTCDGTVEYMTVPDREPVENAPFDIEIARNRVEVEVTDAESKQPLENATVTLAAMIDDPELVDGAHFAGPAGTTDEGGRLVIEPVIANKRVQICASTDEHQFECEEPFTMGKTKAKRVRLALKKIVKRLHLDEAARGR